MLAPRRCRDTVSVPIWHCRWTPASPEMSPSRGTSKRTTSLRKARILGEPRDRVVARGRVRRHALVPECSIDLDVLFHGRPSLTL